MLLGHTGEVFGVCALVVDGRPMLASAGGDETVRVWDAATGEQRQVLHGHNIPVRCVCAVTLDGRAMLAWAGYDIRTNVPTVEIWDVATGEQRQRWRATLAGSSGCARWTLDGRTMLASAGNDKTVRLWDPATGRPEGTIPIRHPATSCALVLRSLDPVQKDRALLPAQPGR